MNIIKSVKLPVWTSYKTQPFSHLYKNINFNKKKTIIKEERNLEAKMTIQAEGIVPIAVYIQDLPPLVPVKDAR